MYEAEEVCQKDFRQMMINDYEASIQENMIEAKHEYLMSTDWEYICNHLINHNEVRCLKQAISLVNKFNSYGWGIDIGELMEEIR